MKTSFEYKKFCLVFLLGMLIFSLPGYSSSDNNNQVQRYSVVVFSDVHFNPLNDSLLQLYPELVTENAKQALYREHYFSGHNYTIPVPNTFNPITDSNWPVYWCGIGNMGEQEFVDCVNSY